MGAITLPKPQTGDGGMALTRALAGRRSVRRYTGEPLSLAEAGQLLWAAQGVTEPGARRRTAPSAGAMLPLALLAVAGPSTVADLDAGIYIYAPGEHALELRTRGDVRADLAEACLHQDFVAAAPMSLLMAADAAAAAVRYGERADRYVAMEAGHVGQNVYLQAHALGLATVAVGAFEDADVASVVRLDEGLIPLYVMPIGHPA